ncbi:MAG: glycoside hydrolase family 15 protein [Candidatus Pacebacteria bacterium]|nr:glycoside hydrolase family 15 protein [Candidatus Paceibacterota bacterium]
MEDKIQKLLESSKKVIIDCSLDNGAMVAANSSKAYYPKDAKNYFYVWPRDGAFNCMAADAIGIKNIQENYFDWLSNRAEGQKETGLFYEKYYPNGLKESERFQVDQTGSVIFSVCNHFKNDLEGIKKYKGLIVNSANALCDNWDKDHFKLIVNDLWEERLAFSDLKDNFLYSLGSCIAGLSVADELFANERYRKVSLQMKKKLLGEVEKKGYIFRSFGKIDDERIDASALGLIWPFKIINSKSELANATIEKIEEKLVKDYGVYRYEHDEYDGWMLETQHRKKGAGYWPLLNFWMSIVLCKMDRKEEAEKYYNKVIESIGDEFIPEQIFSNDIQKSVSPLCWSHAMFIFASRELGYLK